MLRATRKKGVENKNDVEEKLKTVSDWQGKWQAEGRQINSDGCFELLIWYGC